jgi:SAM-dependent methyltransferase
MKQQYDEYESENPFGLEIESDFHLIRKKMTLSLLQEFIIDKEDFNILDVGCGKGNITKFIRQNYLNIRIDAIDISEKAIDFATKKISGVNFYVADAILYSPKNIYYDAIILNNIYEHVENPTLMLNNIKLLLKGNGVVIISTPNRYNIKNIIRAIMGYSIRIPQYHITEYSIGQIYDHHAFCGLKIEKVKTPYFKFEKFKLLNFVLIRLIQPFLDQYLKLRKSKNRLGSLLFIVSKIKTDVDYKII